MVPSWPLAYFTLFLGQFPVWWSRQAVEKVPSGWVSPQHALYHHMLSCGCTSPHRACSGAFDETKEEQSWGLRNDTGEKVGEGIKIADLFGHILYACTAVLST